MKLSFAPSLVVFACWMPCSAAFFCSQGPTDLQDLDGNGHEDFQCVGKPFGQPKIVWKTDNNGGEGHSDDEYKVQVFQNGNRLYSSQEYDGVATSSSSALPGADLDKAGYSVRFQCALEFWNCDDGRLAFKIVDCGCPDGKVPIEECSIDSFAGATDAVCDTACDPGLFYSLDTRQCEECPNFKILSTASVDYSGAVNLDQCGVPGASGFWSLAASGSVAAGGTVVQWELSRSQSASEGVERTNEFAQAYGTVRGQTTSFETSVSVGWTTSVSAGFFGSSVGVESSVDFTATTGQEKSFEVSQESTKSIANAVNTAITKQEEITCSQTCGPDPNDPNNPNGFIFNYVEAIYDENTFEVLHFVRTCATVCKNSNKPPLCPPGKCANRECDVCLGGTFVEPVVDEIASRALFTPSPTSAPEEPDNTDNGGDDDGGFRCFSGHATVQVEHQDAPVSMKDLRVGDKILTSKDGQVYEPVYTFGHRHETVDTQYLRIHTVDARPLEITGEHLVYVEGRASPVRADTVKVGDALVRGQDETSIVQRIQLVNRKGLYAPLTRSGTIVVDGVLASVYADTRPKASTAFQAALSDANVIHVLFSPMRFACIGMPDSILCSEHDEATGFQGYVSFMLDCLTWWEQLPVVFQYVVLFLVLTLTAMLRALELASDHAAVLLLAAVTAWKYARNKSVM